MSVPSRPPCRSRRLPLMLAALAVLLSAPACQPGADGGKKAPVAKPNVLLITVDTLRADHLGAYGYDIPTTPNIDRLAASGTLFEQCVASASETAPAVATILTGLYQHRHGVVFNRASLDAEVLTLAELLGDAGYSSAAIVTNVLINEKRGFDRGFDSFQALPAAILGQSTDDRAVEAALEWLRSTPDGPWFLWLHLMDPHGPYVSAAPWWSEGFDYGDGRFGVEEELEFSKSNFGLGVIPRYQKLKGLRLLSQYVRRYDGEVRFTDAQLGALLGELSIGGLEESTLVVFTADHGESLTEHEEYLQHGWFVYETSIRVPLLVSWPGRLPAGRRIRTPVGAIDIVPTVAELLGIEISGPRGLDGTSFAALLETDDGREGDRSLFSIGPRPNHQFAARSGSWKLIYTPAGRSPVPTGKSPTRRFDTPERIELYDLDGDPGERSNLAADEPERTRALLAEVAGLRARFQRQGWMW